jgi:glycosyltransferase involved in cell wall biosynthesis
MIRKKQSNVVFPLVTIITATFNAETHLPKTIQSIRELTYPNVEWIIIDGNSTDNTLKLINDNKDVIDF